MCSLPQQQHTPSLMCPHPLRPCACPGVCFAVPLRNQVIVREKLKFPSGTAAAAMITTLHQAGSPSGSDTATSHGHARDNSSGRTSVVAQRLGDEDVGVGDKEVGAASDATGNGVKAVFRWLLLRRLEPSATPPLHCHTHDLVCGTT